MRSVADGGQITMNPIEGLVKVRGTVPVKAALRVESGKQAGDTVTVHLEERIT